MGPAGSFTGPPARPPYRKFTYFRRREASPCRAVSASTVIVIAASGHTAAHRPQALHRMASRTTVPETNSSAPMKHSLTHAPHPAQASVFVTTVTPGNGITEVWISAGRYLPAPMIVQQHRQQKQMVKSLPRLATPHI